MLDKANSAIRKLNSWGYTYDGVKWAAPQAPSGQQAEPTDEHLERLADMLWERGEIQSLSKTTAVIYGRAVLALAGQQSERPAPAGRALAVSASLIDEELASWSAASDENRQAVRIFADGLRKRIAQQATTAGQAVGELKAMRMLWDDQPPEERAHYLAVVERAALAASQAERPAVKEE